MHIITLNNYVEYASFLFAIIFLTTDKASFWRVSLIYMLVVCLTETAAAIIGKAHHANNLWLYNIFMFVEASYVSYGLYYFSRDYLKNIGYWILAAYSIILIIFMGSIFYHGIMIFNNLGVNVMSISFVIFCLLYFYALLRDESFIDLKFHPAFWWVGGILIFYFGSTIANFFDDFFDTKKLFGNLRARSVIYTTLNIFLYSFWAYAFICRTRQRKLYL